ncbi:MAG: hypothetical protein R3C56_37015 [Pirellulaceae bacterium]
MILFLLYAAVCYRAYHWANYEDYVTSSCTAYAVLGTILFILLTKSLLGGILRPFLTKVIFAQRVQAWFTPNAFAFSSRFYSKPVVLWRSWKGHPVQAKFEFTEDREAAAVRDSMDFSTRANAKHLTLAMVLRVIVTTVDPNRLLGSELQANLVRSIPLAEIDGHDAHKFTMVLAAANSLTAAKPNDRDHRPEVGFDIDTVRKRGI